VAAEAAVSAGTFALLLGLLLLSLLLREEESWLGRGVPF
jgi:hypothetical protein